MTPIPLNKFADRLDEIVPVMMREFGRRQSNDLFKGKVSLQQFIILDYLLKEKDHKMTELARFMSVTTPAVTGFINRLVKAGYVRRIFDPKDRRVVIIKLKPKGKKLVLRVHKERRQMIMDIFGKISESDRENYLRILSNIRDTVIRKNKLK